MPNSQSGFLFHPNLDLKRHLLKIQLKLSWKQDSWFLQQSFNDVNFIWLADKKSTSISHAEKSTEWVTVRICVIKEESRHSKTLCAREWSSVVTDDVCWHVKLDYTGLIIKINEVCYCDMLLSLRLLPRQFSSNFQQHNSQNTGHDSFPTLIFHKVV